MGANTQSGSSFELASGSLQKLVFLWLMVWQWLPTSSLRYSRHMMVYGILYPF